MESLLLVALIIAVYLGSCAVHPYRPCAACGRSKESRSQMFNAFGPCRSCSGRGHHVRWGARILGKS